MNRAPEMPDSPFETGGGEAAPPAIDGAAPKAFNVLGLRNDTPAVTPSTIGEQLDLAAEWWEHLACGFAKQRSSENPEAWEHYVLAGLIYARDAGWIPDDLAPSDWVSDDVGAEGDGFDPEGPPPGHDSMMGDE